MRAISLLPALFGTSTLATLLATEYPHLLIPLLSFTPNTSYGTQTQATVSYENKTGAAQYTEISFDVPSNNAASCRLNFFINTNTTKNAPRELSGAAPFFLNATRLEPTINQYNDTWLHHPKVSQHYATWELNHAGNVTQRYTRSFECPKGQVAQFVLHPGSDRDFNYYWFELNYSAAEGGPHGIVLEMYS